MKIFKNSLLFIWTFICLFSTYAVIVDFDEEIEHEEKYLSNYLTKTVSFINDYRIENQEYPSKEILKLWFDSVFKNTNIFIDSTTDKNKFKKISYIRSLNEIEKNDKTKFKNVNWSYNFLLSYKVTDELMYYYSWSDKFEYPNLSSAISLSILPFILGISPIFIILIK